MKSERHSRPQEFPMLRTEMQRLRQTNQQFARMVEAFDALDARIERIDYGIERVDDLSFERLKRLHRQSRDELARQFYRYLG